MKPLRPSVLGLLAWTISLSAGCTLCCSPYTDDYVTFGSRTPRLDMKNGRVGSILSDQRIVESNYVEQSADMGPSEYDEESTETVIMDEDAVSIGSPRSNR